MQNTNHFSNNLKLNQIKYVITKLKITTEQIFVQQININQYFTVSNPIMNGITHIESVLLLAKSYRIKC